MKIKTLVTIVLIVLTANVFSQKVIKLETATDPTGIVWDGPEKEILSPQDSNLVVTNVSSPTLTAFFPESGKSNGTALIIAPGGAFHLLAIGHEGTDVAKWCTEKGITAFVLKYRLYPTGADPFMELGQKMQNTDQMDKEIAPLIEVAKADGLAAIAYVREHAKELGIDTDKIGIMGFSAGGTVAAAAAFEYTSAQNRPDFSAPIYPALHVVDTAKMPEDPMPLYMAVSSDDIFGFQTLTLDVYGQWNENKQPVELHIYEKGGHGFGMKKQNLPSDYWIESFGAWLKDHGWL